jgi:hypothetical protein
LTHVATNGTRTTPLQMITYGSPIAITVAAESAAVDDGCFCFCATPTTLSSIARVAVVALPPWPR